MPPVRAASVMCALLVMTATAWAQDAPASPSADRLPVEVSTFLSVGGLDTSSTGVTARMPIRARLSLEAEAEWRIEDVSGLSASGNLVLDLRKPGRVTPYVIGGAGIDRYTVDFGVPQQGTTTQLTSALSVNAGGGVRIPLNARWGMRTDARISNGIGRSPTRWRVFYGMTANVGGGTH
jgi:opacity protein-like surface antigen